MNILVTGGTGFIGFELIRFLCSQGYNPRVLCRSTSDISVLSDNPVQIYSGDIRDLHSIEKAVDGTDCVFHLAGYAKNWAKNPQLYYDVNVIGTKNVLKASQKLNVKKVVFTSTSMTFGPSLNSPIRESEKRTIDFFCDYERTKFYAEEVAAEYVDKGLPVVIVNPTRVFGPGLFTEGNSVTKMIQLYLNRKWRLSLAHGSAIGNYVFIEDVVQGLWLSLQFGKPGQKYILSGENLSLNKFFDTLAEISRVRYHMIHVPYWIALAFSGFLASLAKWPGIYPLITPDWVKVFSTNWAFSSEKAQKELGFKMTPFYEALQRTLVWLSKKKQNP